MSTVKSGVRAVADVDQGRILASVEIAAPADRVFRALASQEITEWWGSPELYRTTGWTGDLRPGGHWRADGVGADGHAFSVEGEFVEVDPPRKLVQTWRAAWDGGHETTITYRLEAIEGGTRLTLRHDGFAERADSCRGHAEGWERVLGWLTKYAGSRETAADDPRYFLCRLMPPRPTFMIDMNAEERDVMLRHAGYWRKMLDEGFAVVFGPVADPQGGWGLGVLRVPSEERLHELRDADPAILSNRGFRYETLPMLRAVTKG
jgi:uncharacterized protein YndB with AHSA1/START domain